MVKITLKHNGKEKTILANEQKAVKNILNEEDIELESDSLFILNGKKLPADDLGKSILDLGYGRETELTLEVTEDVPWDTDEEPAPAGGSVVYPPKAHIVGCACVIISAFTPKDIHDFECYMPEALTMRDEKGEPVFAIELDDKSPGSLTKYGAVFSKITTREGKATITILIDPDCDDMEEAVRESLGSAINSLVNMEEHLMTKMPEMKEKRGLLAEYISVV